jgi:hypothetical protein
LGNQNYFQTEVYRPSPRDYKSTAFFISQSYPQNAGRISATKRSCNEVPFSIRNHLDPGSPVTPESHLPSDFNRCRNNDFDQTSFLGRARFPLRDHLDPDSNVIEESDSHKAKHFLSTTSADAAMLIKLTN